MRYFEFKLYLKLLFKFEIQQASIFLSLAYLSIQTYGQKQTHKINTTFAVSDLQNYLFLALKQKRIKFKLSFFSLTRLSVRLVPFDFQFRFRILKCKNVEKIYRFNSFTSPNFNQNFLIFNNSQNQIYKRIQGSPTTYEKIY